VALVRFEVVRTPGTPEDLGRKGESLARGERSSSGRFATGGRFAVRGRLGLNRLRLSGRVRGRPLAPGTYVLRAVAVDIAGRTSGPVALPFRILRQQN
jgi:hypothetical protein